MEILQIKKLKSKQNVKFEEETLTKYDASTITACIAFLDGKK